MSSLHGVPVSDVVFGNGWAPGSTRRVVVKAADESWNISRNDSSAIHIDAAEHNIRNEIFASTADEGEGDALPFALR
ncbi:hypothetical protein H4R27_002022 [Coemansia aciculifera]|nr:hypothetical protein H4R27_002022 [Coemansia aciculifera]